MKGIFYPIALYEATTVGKDFRKPLLLFSSFQVWFSGADFTNNNAFTLCYWDRCTHEEVWYKDLSGHCMICVSKHKRFHTNHLQRIKEHFKYKNIRTRKNSLFFIFLDSYPIFFFKQQRLCAIFELPCLNKSKNDNSMNVFCGREDKTGERRYISSLQGQIIEAGLTEYWHSPNKLKSSTFPLELQTVFRTLSWAKESFNYSSGRVMMADKGMEGKKFQVTF